MMLIAHQFAQNVRLLGLIVGSRCLGILGVCVIGVIFLVLFVGIVAIALFF